MWEALLRVGGRLQLVQRLDLEAGLAQQADHLAVGEVELDRRAVGVVPLDAVEPELGPGEAVRRQLGLWRRAEDQQRRAGEEDEPAARAQQPRGLRDPARRLAPQARAVLRQREVEARVGQRDVLGVGLDQRELDAVLRLHRPRGRELALRLVDADRPRAAAGEPGREVGGAAAELDRVQAVEVGECVDLRLRDPPHAPGRLRARPVDLGGLDPAIGRAVPQLPVDLLVAHAASARPWA